MCVPGYITDENLTVVSKDDDGNETHFEVEFDLIHLDWQPAERDVGIMNGYWELNEISIAKVMIWVDVDDRYGYYANYHKDQFELLFEAELDEELIEFKANYNPDPNDFI